MSGAVQHCIRCQVWHPAPVPCAHDCEATCHRCGRLRGFRLLGDDGKPAGRAVECWRCVAREVVPGLSAAFVAVWERR